MIQLSKSKLSDDQTSRVSRRKSVQSKATNLNKRKSVLDKRTTYTTYTAHNEHGEQKTYVTSYVQAYEKNVDVQNREIAFDKALREKA